MACACLSLFAFAADQLTRASGEQLSVVIYRIILGFVIAYHTVLHVLKSMPTDYFGYVVEAVSFLSINVTF